MCRPRPSEHAAHVLLDGSQLQHAIRELSVHVYWTGWGEAVGTVVYLLRESLTVVSFYTAYFQDDTDGILHMLAPLESVPCRTCASSLLTCRRYPPPPEEGDSGG